MPWEGKVTTVCKSMCGVKTVLIHMGILAYVCISTYACDYMYFIHIHVYNQYACGCTIAWRKENNGG